MSCEGLDGCELLEGSIEDCKDDCLNLWEEDYIECLFITLVLFSDCNAADSCDPTL